MCAEGFAVVCYKYYECYNDKWDHCVVSANNV